MKLLIDCHPSFDVSTYINKLISELNCKSHIRDLTCNIYEDYKNISSCCDIHDRNDIILHNYSSYSYLEKYKEIKEELELSVLQSWIPDKIIYIFISDIGMSPEEKKINLQLEMIYDDIICPHELYKINGQDESKIIYDTLVQIINNHIN
jgi:hypothetical protein